MHYNTLNIGLAQFARVVFWRLAFNFNLEFCKGRRFLNFWCAGPYSRPYERVCFCSISSHLGVARFKFSLISEWIRLLIIRKIPFITFVVIFIFTLKISATKFCRLRYWILKSCLWPIVHQKRNYHPCKLISILCR